MAGHLPARGGGAEAAAVFRSVRGSFRARLLWGSLPPPARGPSDGADALRGPALAWSRIPWLGSASRAPRPAPPSARSAGGLGEGGVPPAGYGLGAGTLRPVPGPGRRRGVDRWSGPGVGRAAEVCALAARRPCASSSPSREGAQGDLLVRREARGPGGNSFVTPRGACDVFLGARLVLAWCPPGSCSLYRRGN